MGLTDTGKSELKQEIIPTFTGINIEIYFGIK